MTSGVGKGGCRGRTSICLGDIASHPSARKTELRSSESSRTNSLERIDFTHGTSASLTSPHSPLLPLTMPLTSGGARQAALTFSSDWITAIDSRASAVAFATSYRTAHAPARLTTVVSERLARPVYGAIVITS